MRARALAVLALCALAAGASAEDLSASARVAHLRRALQALAELGDGRLELEAELYQAARGRCGERLRAASLDCLLEVARATCAARGATCLAATDLMLVNLRGADELLDEPTRLRLLRRGGDYHRAVLEALRQRYGVLAAELALEDPAAAAEPPVSAAALAQFCARRDARPEPPRCPAPSATCVPSLPWQRCVAAVAWYVSTSKTESP
ncbi:MAG: hypothetical protein R3B48_12565 [Kofleriaceae bacterium]